MSLSDKKVTQAEINTLHVQAANDKFVGNAAQGKAIFDALPEKIAEKYNSLIDELTVGGTVPIRSENIVLIRKKENGDVEYSADGTNWANFSDIALALKADKSDTYTKAETNSQIDQKVVEIGAGDMAKAVYDTDNDGVVDNAENANNAQTADNGLFTYTHTVSGTTHTLTGSGANGKFKATASGTVTAFTVNGTVCSVKQGEDSEIELVSGCWYTFIIDGTTINFRQGGAGLNFKIVGGTVQPTSPAENTIWVNTDVAIGDWQFVSTQPTTRSDGTALQNGDIWIVTATESLTRFNALKNNSIILSLMRCMQLSGTNFITKTAKIFKNSAWVDILQQYLSEGVSFVGNPTLISGNGVANYDSTNGRINFYGTAKNVVFQFGFGTPIDVTNINTVSFDVQITNAGLNGDLQVGLNNALSESYTSSYYIAGTYPTSGYDNNRKTLIVDTSALTGLQYLKFGFTANFSGSTFAQICIYNIKGE